MAESSPAAAGVDVSTSSAAATWDQPISGNEQWHYVAKTGKTEGPCTLDDMRDLLDSGAVTEDTYVWTPSVNEWKAIKTITHLALKLKEDPDTVKEAEKKSGDKKKKRKRKYSPPKQWFELKKNTSVYVTGVAPEVTKDEIVKHFSKAGFIKKDPLTKTHKVKVYKDSKGNQKGDVLVTFVKPESVDLAITLLHETELGGFKITVAPAHFEQKGEQYVPKDNRELRKMARRMSKNQGNMFGWGGDDEDGEPKIIVIKKAFHPREFAEVVNLRQIIRDDMMQACEELGHVDKIKIYQNHPDGVVSIKFRDSLVAREAVEKLNGRSYAGRPLEVEMWDNTTDYRLGKLSPEELKAIMENMKEADGESEGGTDSDDDDDDEDNEDNEAEVREAKRPRPAAREPPPAVEPVFPTQSPSEAAEEGARHLPHKESEEDVHVTD